MTTPSPHARFLVASLAPADRSLPRTYKPRLARQEKSWHFVCVARIRGQACTGKSKVTIDELVKVMTTGEEIFSSGDHELAAVTCDDLPPKGLATWSSYRGPRLVIADPGSYPSSWKSRETAQVQQLP
ncbi:hypothetical protein EVAR_88144_1 [Eumeta japonica]|uniref:Uncharacterized protein n=1 Tax=Eumeta variegata TaxID=151549 RepID=A0A4C1WQX7_EUMVA|nr:hypothetical protein EVAR_88144_1 [Eumeta japonica]